MGMWMKKFFKNWSFGKHISVSVLITIGVSIVGKTLEIMNILISAYSNQAASIGIIGGADGPTSIFIATKLADQYLGIFIIFIALLLLYKPIKRWLEGLF